MDVTSVSRRNQPIKFHDEQVTRAICETIEGRIKVGEKINAVQCERRREQAFVEPSNRFSAARLQKKLQILGSQDAEQFEAIEHAISAVLLRVFQFEHFCLMSSMQSSWEASY